VYHFRGEENLVQEYTWAYTGELFAKIGGKLRNGQSVGETINFKLVVSD